MANYVLQGVISEYHLGSFMVCEWCEIGGYSNPLTDGLIVCQVLPVPPQLSIVFDSLTDGRTAGGGTQYLTNNQTIG